MRERELFLRELEEMETPTFVNTAVKYFNVELKYKRRIIDKKFDKNRYVMFKVAVDVEGSAKFKPLKDSSSFTFSFGGTTYPDANSYFTAILKKELTDNIELKGTVEVGKKAELELKIKHFEMGGIEFSHNFNWTGFYSFKMEKPFSGKMQIGDVIVEGKLKATATLSVGPNWKNIAITEAIKAGWRAIGPGLVTWTTAAGTATALQVIASTVALVGIAVGVPAYLAFRGFTSLYAGHIEGLGSAYASGYTTHLYYNFTGENKPSRVIYFGNYHKVAMARREGDDADKIIKKWGSDKNAITKNMAITLKAVAKEGDFTLRSEYAQNMMSLGAAHAESDLLKLRSTIRRIYGVYNSQTGKYDASNESAELWRLITKFTILNKKNFIQKVNTHIKDQFKSKMGKEKEPIEGYPLDLHDLLEARII